MQSLPNASSQTRTAAERVVARLLAAPVSEDYSSHEDFNSRPGGPKDPYRQTTIPVNLGALDASGRRGGSPFGAKTHAVDLDPDWDKDTPAAETEDEEELKKKAGLKPKPARFNLSFPESRSRATPKSGKKAKGTAVAGKPGKISYREALVQQVLEKLKQKRAGKGTVIASKPGKVSYAKK